MTAFGTARSRLWSLFVDDGRFAGVIVAWLVGAWLVMPRVALLPALHAPLLFAGLCAILVWGAIRQARARQLEAG